MIRKVLVVYKTSVFEKFFKGSSLLKKKNLPVIAGHLNRIYRAHEEHYRSLQKVFNLLKDLRIAFEKAERKDRVDLKPFDLILTVGGDGTFLEVSHQIKGQMILGINSVPKYSVGRYCCTDVQHFPLVFEKLLKNRLKITTLPRLGLSINGHIVAERILNDFLVAHVNPAMMSRYALKIGAKEEEQRSSGIWISTPSGSSGAMKSAGGPVIPIGKKSIIYWPRELHQASGRKCVLTGGILKPGRSLSVVSMMREGMIYGDGALSAALFPYGATAEIGFSAHPLKTFQKD